MITAAQRELRRHHVGASDAAAIMGLDPFRSREDVWAEKVLGLEDDAQTRATSLGNELEPVIVSWAGSAIREQVVGEVEVHTENPQFLHSEGVMLAHPDAVVVHGGQGWKAPIEAKYRSRGAEWGDDSDPTVPIEVLVQATHQMMCMGASFCWVAAYLAERYGITRRLVRCELDENVARLIHEEVHNFWERWVVKRRQPPPSVRGPSLDVMRRLRVARGKTVSVAKDVVEAFVRARDARLEAQKIEDRARAELLLAMGGCENARADDWIVTCREIRRHEYRVKESVYRQLTVRKETEQ